ncbi:MAG: alpha/beta hydrolase, partial [Meiothermus sp.]|nr:alpha/beta hydrolase [Meiothermus sp.]
MKDAFARVNGTRLRFELRGQGAPLVLVHGFTLSFEMWEPQIEAMSAQFQVLRYDLRGFGKSDPPDGTPYRHAEDLAALLDHLELASAHILGCSMGGGIAVDFALTFPERVRSLVLFDSALGGFSYSHQFMAATTALYARGKADGVEAARQLWLEHPMFTPVMASAAADRFHAIVGAYSGWHWVNTDCTRRYETPAAHRLGEIRAPTLVLVGELDVSDMRAIANTLEQNIAGARKVVLERVGHMANLENPALFNQTVLEFLTDIEGCLLYTS